MTTDSVISEVNEKVDKPNQPKNQCGGVAQKPNKITKKWYRKVLKSLRSNTSRPKSASTKGKTGYCMRSLKERPAILFSSVRY